MNLTEKYLVIVNPISGTRSKDALLREIAGRPDITLVFTSGPGDATRLARMGADWGMKGVVAVGGDGTVHEAALGLIGTQTPLGIIPLGSGNGLARHASIPLDPFAALNALQDCKSVGVDYATVCSRPFFCTMGVGFDAEVSARFAKSGRRGRTSYINAVLQIYHNYRPQEYIIEMPQGSIERRAMLVAVANASQYGNEAKIAPKASLRDGLLDVTLLLDGPRLRTAEAALQLFAGGLERNPLIETYRVPWLGIRRKAPGNAHLDGEPALLPSALDVSLHREGLNLLVPNPDVI